MSRGLGAVDFTSQLPDAATAIAGLVTQLGDMWFVAVAACAVFVLASRYPSLTDDPASDSVYLLALAVGAYALTYALKHAFGLPRPPGAATATPPTWIPTAGHAVYESMVTGDGYGFPSGHALKTSVVYGAGALALDVWNRKRRLAVAAGVSVLVAASRVVLGVHYAVDVVAGATVGALFLVGAIRLTDQRPDRALALSTGLGALAVAIAGTAESALALVAPAVGLVVWVGTDHVRGAGADAADG